MCGGECRGPLYCYTYERVRSHFFFFFYACYSNGSHEWNKDPNT